jgi:hypothetical protein
MDVLSPPSNIPAVSQPMEGIRIIKLGVINHLRQIIPEARSGMRG